jgi:serine/threonine protein kinase
MSMGSNRWRKISESNYPWEREALEWLREQLPDRDPWGVWANFEFIDEEGRISEIDALVISPAGIFLVEIKSRPGVLNGDSHTWSWRTDGREYTYPNPLFLANRKAKSLKSLLHRQGAIAKAKIRLPFIEPVIFLSSTSLRCDLQGRAKSATYLRGNPGAANDPGIIAALTNGVQPDPNRLLDKKQAQAIAKALQELGIRPANSHRQVADYRLIKLLDEGEAWQDWQGQHTSLPNNQRRVRIYSVAQAASVQERASRSRQAVREFEVLDGIHHPGILKVNQYTESELGPALIFDYDPKQQRLDHLLKESGAQLTVSIRLQLVRDIAETLQYAHAKRLYHRALGPQSILVGADASGNPVGNPAGNPAGSLNPRLMNWQTAMRDVSNVDTVHRTTGTHHVEEMVEDLGKMYLAPETATADSGMGAVLDIFSLGALAYHIFSGELPATNAQELAEKLRQGQGLSLSDVKDGCGKQLQKLIKDATCPDVAARTASAKEFLANLDRVEDELTAPDPEKTVDPALATQGDRLEGGFSVIKRVGRGSTSDVLLVRLDDSHEELILKVASKPAHNERLTTEGEVLAKLQHQNIVAHRRTLQVAGRTALLLKNAGEKTLASELQEVGRLSLDMLQRFGEELIQVVNYLENEGIAHRDIKPENIGIGAASSGRKQLMVFDFSLCRTPAENILAGTHPYLDPFLAQRRPPRWDLYAERYALAVTLYEMAVGKRPVWGDGQTAPAMLEQEVTLDQAVFDPATREGFCAFFTRALKRDFRQRHDNAEQMLQEWRVIFASQQRPALLDGFEALAQTVNALTTMAELGFSSDALPALERMGVHNARQLLAVDRIKFRYLRGVADKIRKEIRLKAKDLARLRPDLLIGNGSLHDSDDLILPGDLASVDELHRKLLPKRPAGDDNPDELALMVYLGIDTGQDNLPQQNPALWPTLGEAARVAGVSRTALGEALLKARERWIKSTPMLTDLRNQLEELLRNHGQVMTTHEMAQALLAMRGCALVIDAERLQVAHAVLRAAVEAEAQLGSARFEYFPHDSAPMIASHLARVDYARQLGVAADACALALPLLPPARALAALQAIKPQAVASVAEGEAVPVLSDNRLLRLATSASRSAALSSRQEIYPRDMPALEALRQSMGALTGTKTGLGQDELRARVHGRYPQAQALPPRPALDRLLEEVNAPLEWQAGANDGRGAYCSIGLGQGLGAGTTAHSGPRLSTGHVTALPAADLTPAQEAEQILLRKQRDGGLLVLQVAPREMRSAERELLHRFGPALQRLDFDALLLGLLRQQATAMQVDWNVVLRADNGERNGRDWLNLQRLVQRCLPALRQALLHASSPILLCNPGLLARYELMPLVTQLEEQLGRPGTTPYCWLLLPNAQAGLPLLDGVAVPLVALSRAMPLPSGWINNQHRSGRPEAASHVANAAAAANAGNDFAAQP